MQVLRTVNTGGGAQSLEMFINFPKMFNFDTFIFEFKMKINSNNKLLYLLIHLI